MAEMNRIDVKDSNNIVILVENLSGDFSGYYFTKYAIGHFFRMRNLSKYARKVKEGRGEKTFFEEHS